MTDHREPNATITFTIPIKTVSEANAHTHWRVRQKRAKLQRTVAFAHLMARMDGRARGELLRPCVVTLTRVSPRPLDSDNLAGSQKHIRDGVADVLGIDDRDPRVTWDYAQQKGKPREYAVIVNIQEGTNP
jgi:hypothetical protein